MVIMEEISIQIEVFFIFKLIFTIGVLRAVARLGDCIRSILLVNGRIVQYFYPR